VDLFLSEQRDEIKDISGNRIILLKKVTENIYLKRFTKVKCKCKCLNVNFK
jgi:hypothetical protein